MLRQGFRYVFHDLDIEASDPSPLVGPDGWEHKRAGWFRCHINLNATAMIDGVQFISVDRRHMLNRVIDQPTAVHPEVEQEDQAEQPLTGRVRIARASESYPRGHHPLLGFFALIQEVELETDCTPQRYRATLRRQAGVARRIVLR